MTAAVPLKRLVNINRREMSESTDPDHEFRYIDIGSVGQGRLVAEPQPMRFADAPSRARRLVEPSDTIVSTVRTYLRAVWPVEGRSDDLVVSSGFAVLSPRADIDPRFLGWLAQSSSFIEEVVARSTGVSYPAISPSQLGEILVPAISVSAQRDIANHLATETRRIDRLVRAKRSLAQLLADRAEATVAHLIWRDDDRPRETGPLRRIASRVDVGIAEAATHAYTDSGVPLIRSTNIRANQIDTSDLLFIERWFAERNRRKYIRSGDIVTVRTGNVGVSAVVPPELDASQCFTQLITTVRAPNLAEFVCYALNCGPAREFFSLVGWGSAQANISVPLLASAPVPIATAEEQVDALCRLHEQLMPLQKALALLDAQLFLLEEHRQALVTAAVTGQLVVNQGAA